MSTVGCAKPSTTTSSTQAYQYDVTLTDPVAETQYKNTYDCFADAFFLNLPVNSVLQNKPWPLTVTVFSYDPVAGARQANPSLTLQFTATPLPGVQVLAAPVSTQP